MLPGAGRQQRVLPILLLMLKPLIVPYPLSQLWEVSSGELLLSVLFDVGIMAVTLDLSEYHMFCGGMDGSIFQVDLCAWVSVWGCRSAGCCSEPPSPPCWDWCDQGVGGSGFPRVSSTPSRHSYEPAGFSLPQVKPLSPFLPSFLQPVQRDRTFQTERENGKIFKGHR